MMIEKRRIVGQERIIEYVLVRVLVCGVLVRRLVKGEVRRWVLCFSDSSARFAFAAFRSK